MKKSGIWVVLGILAVGGVGYFLYTKMKKNKGAASKNGLGVEDLIPAPSPSVSSEWKDYIVTTATSSLNVRRTPDISGSFVTSLAKGSTIKARPSAVSGWMEVSRDGVTSLGFSSSAYLTAK